MGYKDMTDEELQERYANADTTASMCSGHNKTHHNRNRVRDIAKEMESRGIKPDGRKGEFNGVGSF